MVTAVHPHSFRRRHDGVLIYLRLDEWPADVPQPKESVVVETGDGPFSPYWRLILESTRTVEVVVGWFKTPRSLANSVTWYQDELNRLGWLQDSTKGHDEPESVGLDFAHPETGARLEISLRWWPHKQETTAMIRRVIEHPWQPVEEQAVAAEAPLPRDVKVPVAA